MWCTCTAQIIIIEKPSYDGGQLSLRVSGHSRPSSRALDSPRTSSSVIRRRRRLPGHVSPPRAPPLLAWSRLHNLPSASPPRRSLSLLRRRHRQLTSSLLVIGVHGSCRSSSYAVVPPRTPLFVGPPADHVVLLERRRSSSSDVLESRGFSSDPLVAGPPVGHVVLLARRRPLYATAPRTSSLLARHFSVSDLLEHHSSSSGLWEDGGGTGQPCRTSREDQGKNRDNEYPPSLSYRYCTQTEDHHQENPPLTKSNN